MADVEKITPLPTGPVQCPVCGKRTTAAGHRPFCSKRCADIDLGRWLKGNYRVETDEGPEEFPDQEEQARRD